MQNDRAGLVMHNPDRGRRIATAVIRPSDETSEHVLRPLKPFEANHRGCACLRISSPDRGIGEHVYLFARDSRLYRLGAPVLGHALPRIWHVPVKDLGMEAMHNLPSTRTKSHKFFALARSQATGTAHDAFVNFVRRQRS